MNNERGGILSRLFAIPVGVALMVGFFFLGYYVGKYQSKSNAPGEASSPLPGGVAGRLPKPEDFTFYKTLTEKDDKTVSIDLKPKPTDDGSAEKKSEKKTEKKKDPAAEAREDKNKPQPKQEKKIEVKIEKPASPPPQQAAPKPQQVQARKEPAPPSNAKQRYTVQIASYQEKSIADEDVKKLKKRGYAAFVVSSNLAEKGTWYRVRLGSFTSKAAAEKLMNELRTKEGINPFVTLE